ncbi:MAG TPA: ATP-binding protein [Bryobacteraceae bacterium]
MKTLNEIVLTSAQSQAYHRLLDGIAAGDVLVLEARAGAGKTTILEKVQAAAGGLLIGVRQFMQSLASRAPAAIEEAFLDMIERALAEHDLVIVDDLHLITQVVTACDYPRACLLDAALTAMLGDAAALRKRLVFAVDGDAPWPIRRRAYIAKVPEFKAEDYQVLCHTFLGDVIGARLAYPRLHRFAPALSAQQLRNACRWLAREPDLDTEQFLDYLRADELTSNVDTDEVQRVDWRDLKGVDEVIRELEVKVALPFENDALSAELRLKPKRGVLLAGPPGTGKTTIGRALAHRLKSKFFHIDGTLIAGTGDFYRRVGSVFAAAKQNAPAVVFIDDADVIFEDEDNRGFYRYLLTMLDGLESASAERVCVIMTAMHPGSLPPAMLRSGRVELWLETQLPDAAARAAILRERIAGLPEPIGSADVTRLAAASHGLTGADLKNVVEDAKLLFAHERAGGGPVRPADDYYLEAIETVFDHQRKYVRSKPPKLSASVKFGFTAG